MSDVLKVDSNSGLLLQCGNTAKISNYWKQGMKLGNSTTD